MENLDIIIRKMDKNDVPGLMDLKNSVEWGQTEEDWLRLMKLEPNGCFVAVNTSEMAEKIIGCVTTTSYGTKLGWIGMLIVYEEYRKMGIGFQLMMRAFDYLRGKNIKLIKLDASELGKPLYLKNGFSEEGKMIKFHLILQEYNKIKRKSQPSSITIKNIFKRNSKIIDEKKLNFIREYDFKATKIDRSDLLSNFIKEFPETVFVAWEKNKVIGYILAHEKIQYIEIGPFVADSISIATQLLSSFIENCKDNSILIGTFEHKKEFAQVLVEMGFHLSGFNTRMFFGDLNNNSDNSLQWAISGAAKG